MRLTATLSAQRQNISIIMQSSVSKHCWYFILDDTTQRLICCPGNEGFLPVEGHRGLVMRSPKMTGSCPGFRADVNGSGFQEGCRVGVTWQSRERFRYCETCTQLNWDTSLYGWTGAKMWRTRRNWSERTDTAPNQRGKNQPPGRWAEKMPVCKVTITWT